MRCGSSATYWKLDGQLSVGSKVDIEGNPAFGLTQNDPRPENSTAGRYIFAGGSFSSSVPNDSGSLAVVSTPVTSAKI